MHSECCNFSLDVFHIAWKEEKIGYRLHLSNVPIANGLDIDFSCEIDTLIIRSDTTSERTICRITYNKTYNSLVLYVVCQPYK